MTLQKYYKKYFKPDTKLYPFQLKTLSFLRNKTNGKAIIAHEMGLGKSLITLSYLFLNPKKNLPAVIIAPARLKYNWQNEIKKFFRHKKISVQIIESAKAKLRNHVDVVIMSYNALPIQRKLKKLEHIKFSEIGQEIYDNDFKTLIMDEAHYIANSNAKRTKAIKKLSKKFNNILCLSGTPLRNRPENYFNILNIIDNNTFNNWMSYAFRYCDAKQGYFGMDTSGASNLDELHDKTKGIIIRYTKKQVLKDLPSKSVTYMPVDVKMDSDSILVENLQELRQQIGIAKVPVALEFIKDFHDENPNKNLIVFAHHHKVSDQIYYGLQDIYKEQIVIRKIDGRTPKKLYQENIDEFQKNKIKVFIVGIQGAVGYNLTKASTALFVEMLYVPSDLVQAEDRLWRIGTEDNVNIYYLVARNTLDAYMMQILQNKNKIISEVLEGMQIKDDGIERCLKMICG